MAFYGSIFYLFVCPKNIFLLLFSHFCAAIIKLFPILMFQFKVIMMLLLKHDFSLSHSPHSLITWLIFNTLNANERNLIYEHGIFIRIFIKKIAISRVKIVNEFFFTEMIFQSLLTSKEKMLPSKIVRLTLIEFYALINIRITIIAIIKAGMDSANSKNLWYAVAFKLKSNNFASIERNKFLTRDRTG